MALLTGTTADGIEVPVQVKPTGELVAEGLTGPQGAPGPAGPAGPAGPKGDDQWKAIGASLSYTSGPVLVGTSTNAPSDTLFVVHGQPGNANEPAVAQLRRGGTILADYTLGQVSFADGSGNVAAHIRGAAETGWGGTGDAPSRLTFSTTADGSASPVERLRIDSAGRCRVTGGILRVDPSNAANGAYLVFASNQLQVGNDSAGYTNYVYLAAGGSSWTASSDERQKTDLVPIDDGLNKVGSLRAVTGRYLSDADGTSRSFLVAQDVQSVLPEAVDASNPDSLGVSYTDVIPLLVAALKESKDRIETLEAKVAALESA